MDLQLDPDPGRPRDPGADVDEDTSADAPRGRANGAERAQGERPVAAERDCCRVGEQPLTRKAGEHCPLARDVLQADVLDAADRRVDNRRRNGHQLPLRLVRCPGATAAAAGRDAAEQRPEARERARRPGDEDGRPRRRHAGTDRAAEGAKERELERAGAIRVEPADDLAAPGTGELVVGRRGAALHLHPRALDRDADDEPVAFRSRARRRRAEARDRGGGGEHQQRAFHGSLPKRNAETAPAASSRKAPPAAKPAVISRSFLTLPIREPSSS